MSLTDLHPLLSLPLLVLLGRLDLNRDLSSSPVTGGALRSECEGSPGPDLKKDPPHCPTPSPRSELRDQGPQVPLLWTWEWVVDQYSSEVEILSSTSGIDFMSGVGLEWIAPLFRTVPSFDLRLVC